MKHWIFVIAVVSSIQTLFGQEKYSFEFNGESMAEALERVEDQSGIHFYFNNDWIDSLAVSGTFSEVTLEELMKEFFEGTTLSFYRYDDRIILTNNVLIIDQPEITRAYRPDTSSVSVIEKGLVFSREYFDQADQSDLENTAFEIGNRNNLVPGGSSTIAGYVLNAENDEPVEGALVYVQDPFIAASSDEKGFYSLTLPNGKHQLFVQFVGMKNTVRNVVLFSNGRFDIDMQVDVIALQEVLVESDRDINISNVQMGISRIDIEESKNIPIVLGEKDIMKVATTVAGVQTVGEGASGFNVRGGKADQNLIIVNDAPIYNASHFFGFFSVFNSEAVESMEIYKSGIPAKFGGRLSSVFDIQSKSANKEKVAGEGGISPITGRLTLELPLKKDKTSVLLSGRTTYSNWILRRSSNAEFNGNEVSFGDINATIDHEIDDKNHLKITGYYSKDRFKLTSDTLFSFSDFDYSNINAAAKWSHQFNNNFDLKATAILAGYGYNLAFDDSPPNAFVQDFRIDEKTLDVELNNFIGESHVLNYGAGLKHYKVNPGTKQPLDFMSIVAPQVLQEERGLESYFHFSDQYEFSDRLQLYLGLRYSMFNAFGPQQVFTYEQGRPVSSDSRNDSTSFGRGDIISTYHGPEFRISGRYNLNDNSSVKFSYNKTRQYVHVMTNSAALSPTDTWRLSSPHLLPQISDQLSAGLYRNFFGNRLETSIEGYYKFLENLKDFKTGSEFLLRQYIERDILQGPGKSYGVEFSIKKKGKLNGWINYSFSRTFIRLDGTDPEEIINGGEYFPTAYDKPHTVNVVSNYKFTRRFSMSFNMTYNTGRPVTVPVAVYNLHGFENIHFSERNKYRIPDYFRIDLGLNLEGNHKIKKLTHSFWSLSIYNLLGRDNPYSVFFNVEEGRAQGYQLVVFGDPIPTLSYNFKF